MSNTKELSLQELQVEEAALEAQRKEALARGEGLAAVRIRGRLADLRDLIAAAHVRRHLQAKRGLEAEDARLAAEEESIKAELAPVRARFEELRRMEDQRIQAVKQETEDAGNDLHRIDNRLSPVLERRHEIAGELERIGAAIDGLVG